MKRIVLLWMLFLLWPGIGYAESLQQTIDALPDGSELVLEPVVYHEEVSITKPLRIIGSPGTIFRVDGESPAISIENTQDVQMRNVDIEQGDTAVLIKSSENITIEEIEVSEAEQAVEVHDSKTLTFRELLVEGPAGHYSAKGNGVALYNSEDIQVSDSAIRHMRDGIYAEKTTNLQTSGNRIENSRYGVHLMYSRQADLSGNVLSENVAGVMLMMTEDSRIQENTIHEHTSPNASGLVLYEAQNIQVTGNVINANALGLSLQKVKNSQIENNKFYGNQIGMEFIRSAENNTRGNEFTGNIVQLRSDALGGMLAGNYYDDASLLDLDEDGYGDTPYTALQSYGQWMVREPAYQYFIEAPAVVLLNEMDRQMNSMESAVLMDSKPLAKPPSEATGNPPMSLWRLFLGAMLLAFGGWIWKKESVA
ncbi:right-handed parallel beta-helix repeat-containing protein [Planococcus citreus]|uniref:Nitrous oxidase accessory protein n=1 Tax=Planococcus citreus TaxID=1373 RepID=A0A497YSP2_9BACL|nr:right-handed parallel beta-helix repeat-containing protein [Planococcus citreus]RLJ91353.1 nitrous oxidase accessory protein [Planococcus citreus]